MTIFPTILRVPSYCSNTRGREKIVCLGSYARKALSFCAIKSGVVLGELQKDENNIPRPCNGYYWSISHKNNAVAAVVSKKRIGIDIEEVTPRHVSVFGRTACEEEWELSGDISWHTFFRYWTAKEAVLKATGTGIKGLKACRVLYIPDNRHIILWYEGQYYTVEQLYYNNHIVSVLQENNDDIEWIIIED